MFMAILVIIIGLLCGGAAIKVVDIVFGKSVERRANTTAKKLESLYLKNRKKEVR